MSRLTEVEREWGPPPESYWRWLTIFLSGVYVGWGEGPALEKIGVIVGLALFVLALRVLVFGRRGHRR